MFGNNGVVYIKGSVYLGYYSKAKFEDRIRKGMEYYNDNHSNTRINGITGIIMYTSDGYTLFNNLRNYFKRRFIFGFKRLGRYKGIFGQKRVIFFTKKFKFN